MDVEKVQGPQNIEIAMGIKHHYDPESGIVRACWDGPIALADVRDYWNARVAELQVEPHRRALVDLRTCQVGFSGTDMGSLIQELLKPSLQKHGHRVAILVAGPVQFGTGRQFQAFFSEIGESSVFTSETEALAWLSA